MSDVSKINVSNHKSDYKNLKVLNTSNSHDITNLSSRYSSGGTENVDLSDFVKEFSDPHSKKDSDWMERKFAESWFSIDDVVEEKLDNLQDMYQQFKKKAGDFFEGLPDALSETSAEMSKQFNSLSEKLERYANELSNSTLIQKTNSKISDFSESLVSYFIK